MKLIDDLRRGVREGMINFLGIEPATDRQITVRESCSHRTEVMKNRIWYRGDPSEIEEFFKQMSGTDNASKSRFWAAAPSDGYIRKFHTGIYAIIIDTLVDLILGDFQGIDFNPDSDTEVEKPEKTRWEEIAEDNKWDTELFRNALTETLITGDGVFKISYDREVSEYPIIEFISGEGVEIVRKRGRVKEYQFITIYTHPKDKTKKYKFVESYGMNYITYRLYDDHDKEVPLTTLEQTAEYTDVTWKGDFFLCVPMQFYKNPKFEGRGMPLLERKSDNVDALDEVMSQLVDAVRAGRVMNYIPADLLPTNTETGEKLRPNSFDNKFIKTESVPSEGNVDKIEQIQADIDYNAYITSYATFLDLILQGVLSPSSLGIDLKKLDNAEAQREKEKTTLKTRAKIVDTLTEVIPKLIETVLRCSDNLIGSGATAQEYISSVVFGEYASPSFNEKIEVVSKASAGSIMSIERQVDELWGDTMTEEEQEEEVKRIKELRGIGVIEVSPDDIHGFEDQEPEKPEEEPTGDN